MLRRILSLLFMGAFGAILLQAGPHPALPKQKASHQRTPVIGGSTEPEWNVPPAPWRPTRHSLDQPIGTTYMAGSTWYDYQHNGTCGKMIDVDEFGGVHVVWMKGYNATQNPRHVFYNCWDPMPGAFAFDTIGIRINASQRAGYISQTTNSDGFCFPAFHQVTTGDPHAAAAGVYIPCSDAFTSIEPDWCYEGGTALQIIWPKIAMDINGVLHMISTEATDDVRQRIYYSRGVPEFDQDGYFLDIHWDQMSCGGFELFDTVTTISPDIACSRHSERVVIAYTYPMFRPGEYPDAPGWHQRNNEVYMLVSEDGGLNWDNPVNVTKWTPWDPECWYGSEDIVCNRDTFRAYTDCAVLLDERDNIHIAFTTPGFWWYQPGTPDTGLYTTFSASLIWHWSEAT
ncbi:MAG: hypothetical protein FJY66_04115, partial [Calditrichaeota bacterium]|nr:hypothetical protein [Calditrichota bacterium]